MFKSYFVLVGVLVLGSLIGFDVGVRVGRRPPCERIGSMISCVTVDGKGRYKPRCDGECHIEDDPVFTKGTE